MEKLLRLTAEQKCDIAQREVEECQTDARRANDESERVIENLHVSYSTLMRCWAGRGVRLYAGERASGALRHR